MLPLRRFAHQPQLRLQRFSPWLACDVENQRATRPPDLHQPGRQYTNPFRMAASQAKTLLPRSRNCSPS